MIFEYFLILNVGELQWKYRGENRAFSEPVTRISEKSFSGDLNCSGVVRKEDFLLLADGRKQAQWD